MKEACRQLLTRRLAPGLAASCVRFADGDLDQACFNRWLTPTQIRRAVLDLVRGLEALPLWETAPSQASWVFTNLRLLVRRRPDDAYLALFLENRPDLPWAEIQSLLEEFARLPAGQ